MDLAIIDNVSAPSEIAALGPSRITQGLHWGGLSVVVLSGWIVVTCASLRQDLQVWDVIALRIGEGALFPAPDLLIGPLRLRMRAGPNGILLALLWQAPFILLVAFGLRATLATLTSFMTPALIPVFAGLLAWTFLGERPSRLQLCSNGMNWAGLLVLIYGFLQAEDRLDISGAAWRKRPRANCSFRRPIRTS